MRELADEPFGGMLAARAMHANAVPTLVMIRGILFLPAVIDRSFM